MKTRTLPRARYDRARKGYPQAEVVSVGRTSVKVRPEEREQREKKHIIKGDKK